MLNNNITELWQKTDYVAPNINLVYYEGRYIATSSDTGPYLRFIDNQCVYTILKSKCEVAKTVKGHYIYQCYSTPVIKVHEGKVAGARDKFVLQTVALEISLYCKL